MPTNIYSTLDIQKIEEFVDQLSKYQYFEKLTMALTGWLYRHQSSVSTLFIKKNAPVIKGEKMPV
jgi:hypothetical protein